MFPDLIPSVICVASPGTLNAVNALKCFHLWVSSDRHVTKM